MILIQKDLLDESLKKFLDENKVYYKVIEDHEIKEYCVVVGKTGEKNQYILAEIEPNKIKILKWDLRFKVWRKMLKNKVAKPPYPVFGRIPNFIGSEIAARNLLKIPEFLKAKRVLVNPDSPQRPVRELILKMGKTLVMPTPKLKRGYLEIKNANPREASTIKGAFKYGKPTSNVNVDFMIEGSVAVDKSGNRLGKGGGFGDIEIKVVRKINPSVVVATTVHDIQIVEKVPTEEKDEKVDIIVTPSKIIKCKNR